MKILTLGHNFLRTKAQPVKNINGKLIESIDKMTELMNASNGVGLAAVQGKGAAKDYFIVESLPGKGSGRPRKSK